MCLTSVGAFAQTVSPDELDRRIEEVIHETKYTWRMPREAGVDDAEKGVISRFVDNVAGFLRSGVNTVLEWVGELLRKAFSPGAASAAGGSSLGWTTVLLYVLIAAILSALVIFMLRVWRDRNRPGSAIFAQEIQGTPDIADENVAADQLPEDAWTRMARDLLERGELRLAVRAFYLASLAHLAKRNLIGIARFKSNRDYERELVRRGHAIPQVLPVFRENVSIFERIWYGMHDINRELVHEFATNVEKIKTAT
jgi:hypothetical protein